MPEGIEVGAHGPGGAMRRTWPFQRTLLAVVHHLTAGTRLADVLPAVEADPRVQVVYTIAPTSPFAADGERFVRGLDAACLPWSRVRDIGFDLAVAANHGGLEQVRAPVLTLSHGVGGSDSLAPRRPGGGPAVPRPWKGHLAGALAHYGRVVPEAIGVAHERERDAIAQAVPEAAAVTHVVGDPCLDRLLVSTGHRDHYRRALGLPDDRRLVVVTSTWGPGSLLGTRPELLTRLVAELPSRYRIAAVIHPLVWAWHGRRQVRAWLRGARRAGLLVVPPEEGWRAAVLAADLVIGDGGSVTCYAAALSKPLLLGTFPDDDIAPDSARAAMASTVRRLRHGERLAPQIAAALLRHPPPGAAEAAADFCSVPGQSAKLLRRLMYRMMDLAEPEHAPVLGPVPDPVPLPPPEPVVRPASGRDAA